VKGTTETTLIKGVAGGHPSPKQGNKINIGH